MIRIAFLTTDNRDHHRKYDIKEPYFGPAPEALLMGLADIPKIETHVITCTQKFMPSPKIIFRRIFFHSLVVPKWGWLRSAYFGCRYAVYNKLQELRPDLVHAQGTERDCAMSAVGCLTPKVLTLHGNIRRVAKVLQARPFSYWWLQARLESWVLPRYDGIVCLSRHAQRQVAGRARRTWVVPNAVDPSFFGIPRASLLPKRILCAATISPLKNQLGLLASLETLPLKYPYELRFFGGVDQKSSYGKNFLHAVANKTNVFFGGNLDRAELKNELSKASILILPSLEENCPMIILEAQAAGVPVIASNVGGVKDLIEDGANGILTDPSKPETMARALHTLLGNENLARSLSEAGRMQAARLYTPSKVAGDHLRIYGDLLVGKNF